MTISKNSTYYRVFLWSIKLQEALSGGPLSLDYARSGTNFCHLVRSIVIYIPFVFIMQALFVLAPLTALVGLPLWLFGLTGWIHTLEVFGLGAASMGLSFLVYRLYDVWAHGSALPLTERELSFLAQWIVAKKSKICPFIEWSEP